MHNHQIAQLTPTAATETATTTTAAKSSALLLLDLSLETSRLGGYRERQINIKAFMHVSLYATLAGNLGLGQESVHWQKFIEANVDLVVFFKCVGGLAVLHLDGKENLVQGAEDLVNLANHGLVLQVDGCIEEGHLGVVQFADHFALTGALESTDH